MVQASNKSGQIKSLSFTSGQFKSVVNGNEKSRVEALKELLDYPIVRKDPQGSRFWYLKPGENESAAEDTQPIAVGFYKELLPNLKVSSTDEKEYSFADIYAQTIADGLFTARVFSYERNQDDLISTEFNRQTAGELLPETNPFLRRLFQNISERSRLELGDELIEAIVEIISYLRVAKMEVILRDFHQKIDREDIVIRFYEDLLAAYKPQMRVRHIIIARAGELARIPFKVHPYQLRHACGYYLAAQGHDTRAIQDYLGHKNIHHTVRYTQMSPQRFENFWTD